MLTLPLIKKGNKAVSSHISIVNKEKIFLFVSGLLALARNEVFASTQTVFQNDDAEEESIDGSDADDDDKRRSLNDPQAKTYVPTVGFDEPFFTVPGSYLIQVQISTCLLYMGYFTAIFRLLGVPSLALPLLLVKF